MYCITYIILTIYIYSCALSWGGTVLDERMAWWMSDVRRGRRKSTREERARQWWEERRGGGLFCGPAGWLSADSWRRSWWEWYLQGQGSLERALAHFRCRPHSSPVSGILLLQLPLKLVCVLSHVSSLFTIFLLFFSPSFCLFISTYKKNKIK